MRLFIIIKLGTVQICNKNNYNLRGWRFGVFFFSGGELQLSLS